MYKTKTIIANRTDGLGERLAAMLNGAYLSFATQSNFKFNWHFGDFSDENICKHVICPFVPSKEDFFAKEFIASYHLDYLDYGSQEVLWWYKGQNIKKVLLDLFKNDEIIQCSVATYMNAYFSDVDKNEYREKLYDIFYNFFQFSQPINTALEYASSVASTLDDYDVIHVRGGDILYRNTFEAMYAAIPVHFAIKIIQDNPQRKMIIMGNDIEANLKIKYLFKELKRENIFVSDDFQIDSFDATQKAMFDIVLISKSKKLYLSGGSAFSVSAFLIGGNKGCEPQFVYDIYSNQEIYDAINLNMQNYSNLFNKYHNAFSCLFLYVFGKKLNLSLLSHLNTLNQAMSLRDDVYMYKLLYVDILLQQRNYFGALAFIENLAINSFVADLFYESYGIPNNFCYFFVFNHYLNIENIKDFPILYNIANLICYRLIKANNKIFVDSILKFLYRNLIDFELIENCSFVENKQDVINTLLVYFMKSFKEVDPKASAVLRVKNHLAYKLGQAMIENSQSIFGWVRMPYVLFYIKDKHKKEQLFYKANIKENPELVLCPLEACSDYKESLKIKNYFSYKLGQSLIEASKLGILGYFKFILNLKELRKKLKG